jgi:hypothetical protein
MAGASSEEGGAGGVSQTPAKPDPVAKLPEKKAERKADKRYGKSGAD